jgi:prepilin-type processing-associated H-X9-DG protein
MTINDVEGGEQLLNCHNNSQPYGFHAGGLNFVFADATVRFVAADMAADPLISWFTLRAGD